MDIVVLRRISNRRLGTTVLIPKSIAQIPVPVARSRTFRRFVMGARCSLLSKVMTNR